jgi:hypothetical protein
VISVQEVVTDPDMIAPRPYTILRSVGTFVLGGFESTTTAITTFGPVQQMSDKEISVLPEADRVGALRSFWNVQPIYVTRGTVPLPGTHGEVPVGSGVTYTLSEAPPDDFCTVYSAGLQLQAGVDYVVNGTILTFTAAPGTPVYVTWTATVDVGQAASDIIVYGDEQYRIIRVYHDFGGGYFKAIGSRMAAA